MGKPKLHIASCSFGKDSIATILLALEHKEPLDRVVFSEVMFDHEKGISGEIPEHIQWIREVAIPKLESMGVRVDVVRSKKDYVTICRTKWGNRSKRYGRYYGVSSGPRCWVNSSIKISSVKDYFKKLSENYDIIFYVGIAIDEPKRLARLEGTNKVSLLEKYGYTEAMAMDKCKEYNLISPCYTDNLGGAKTGLLVLL